MNTQNCWEVLKCGREIGGAKVDEMGVCPAASAENYDGVNSGVNAGRFCWAIDETLCHGEIQGKIADKALACMQCAFYVQVVTEQRPHLIVHPSQLL